MPATSVPVTLKRHISFPHRALWATGIFRSRRAAKARVPCGSASTAWRASRRFIAGTARRGRNAIGSRGEFPRPDGPQSGCRVPSAEPALSEAEWARAGLGRSRLRWAYGGQARVPPSLRGADGRRSVPDIASPRGARGREAGGALIAGQTYRGTLGTQWKNGGPTAPPAWA